MQKILLRMQRRHTSGAFAAWLRRTQKARQLKAAATRVVGRLAHSCVVGAYGRWVEYWAQMAHFKAPKHVVHLPEGLPKTSTGKVQKFELRERARAM